jgi:hypothetical protein
MSNNLIRCGLHLEIRKFGKVVDPTHPDLKDQLESDAVVEDATFRGISRIGVDLTFAEDRALFAVQRLFDDADYRGNVKPAKAGEAYHFQGELPRMEVPVAKYLHAYGVRQKKSKRGKQEFNAKSREAALNALRGLRSKEFLMAYERKYGANGNEKIEVIAPLIDLGETGGKVTITPNPIMVDQIDSYFLWKPVDLYTHVLSGKDRSEALFIEYLLFLFEMNRRMKKRAVFVVKRQPEVMAHALRMTSLIGSRQNSRMRQRLIDLYERGQEVGYLQKYETDVPGKRVEKLDCLHLNSEKFKAMRVGLPVNVAGSTSNVRNVYL